MEYDLSRISTHSHNNKAKNHYLLMYLNIAGRVANSIYPDQTPRSAASDLGLPCLLRSVCPNTSGSILSLYLLYTF